MREGLTSQTLHAEAPPAHEGSRVYDLVRTVPGVIREQKLQTETRAFNRPRPEIWSPIPSYRNEKRGLKWLKVLLAILPVAALAGAFSAMATGVAFEFFGSISGILAAGPLMAMFTFVSYAVFAAILLAAMTKILLGVYKIWWRSRL
ncbi:MAG: hypothetical protein AAB573_00320 [Patescibacteria group bacterium]